SHRKASGRSSGASCFPRLREKRLMSIRTALAKLAAAAAGGALVGGAVHVAEPQAARTRYKSVKQVKAERPVKSVKPQVRRAVPPSPVPPPLPPEQPVETEVAAVPIPLPPLPQAPVLATGESPPIVIGGSGG